MNKNHNIIIKGDEKSVLSYLNSEDRKEEVNNIVVPDYIKKHAEVNQFAIIIDNNREVPFKMKKAGSDDWYVGKCSKYDWSEKVSKYATAITWKTWIEMYTGISVSKQIRNELTKAMLGTGIFSITARTLKPIDNTESTDKIEVKNNKLINLN